MPSVTKTLTSRRPSNGLASTTQNEPQSGPVVPMPNGQNLLASLPILDSFKPGKIWTSSPSDPECQISPNHTVISHSHPPKDEAKKLPRKVHWNENINIELIEPSGRMIPTKTLNIPKQDTEQQDPNQRPKRNKQWRDQIKNIIAALRQIDATNLLYQDLVGTSTTPKIPCF